MADLEERSAQAGLFATAHGAGIEAPRRAGGTAAVDVATAGDSLRNGAGRGRVAPEVAATAAARSHNGVGLRGASLDGDAVVAGGRMSCGSGSGGGMARGSGSGDGLLGLLDPLVAGLRALGSEHLEERLQIVGRCEARLAAVRAETVAALARRDGEARAADVLRNDLKQSRGGAKRDVKIAGQLAELPETAEALAEGAITPQHARIIAEASEHAPVDEAELLAAAGHEPVDVFARTVRDHVNDRSGDDLEERRRTTTCGVDGAVNQPLRRCPSPSRSTRGNVEYNRQASLGDSLRSGSTRTDDAAGPAPPGLRRPARTVHR